MLETSKSWKYPDLAKPDSDGVYCYWVQRRISIWFSVRLAPHIGANVATGLDLIFGVAAAVLVFFDQWLWGVMFIQLFGIFSCVDGEIARIRGQASKIGDFLDTMTDRSVEVLLVGAIAYSLRDRVDPESAIAAALALLGGVMLLTASSEKFRSSWQVAYPKRRLERLFCAFCGGSEARLLMLSMGLIVCEFQGSGSFMLGLMWTLAAATYVNFVVRLGLVYRHYRAEDVAES